MLYKGFSVESRFADVFYETLELHFHRANRQHGEAFEVERLTDIGPAATDFPNHMRVRNEDIVEDIMFAGVNKYVSDSEDQAQLVDDVANEQGKSLLRP